MHMAWDGPLPAGAIEIPRLPEPFEEWDGAAFIVADPVARANWLAGAAHIAEARALKYLEAVVIASGFELTTGMLAAEAVAKGIALADLADQVLAKRTDFISAEVLRQQRQSGAD